MDVTPHDLRNAELREAFRGYRPDEVEELLERAAVTLERMHERIRLAQERIAQVEQEAANGREMESVLRQTLLLAQRTADETVTSAHEQSRQLVEEAEDRALAMTTEAEEQARSLGEAHRQKYEAIVAELSARRDVLTADIDALERVQADYRGRLRAVLERELAELERRAELPPPARPELHEVDVDLAGAEEDELGPVEASPAALVEPRSGNGHGHAPPAVDEDSGGPPTEALVVIDEDFADVQSSGPGGTGGDPGERRPGPAARRRS